MASRQSGFTLLEVLLALVLFTLTVGGLLEQFSRTLHALANARHEAEVLEEVEVRMRTLAAEARLGNLPPLGTTEGRFEPPHEHLRWELTVESYTFPLPALAPAALARARESSTLYAEPSRNPRALQPSARIAVLRVLDEEDAEPFEPFTIFAVEEAIVSAGVAQPDGGGAGVSRGGSNADGTPQPPRPGTLSTGPEHDSFAPRIVGPGGPR